MLNFEKEKIQKPRTKCNFKVDLFQKNYALFTNFFDTFKCLSLSAVLR